MVYMGQNDGARLVDEEFQAWDYGPVLPDVYHKAKVFGADPVGNVFHSVEVPRADSGEAEMLQRAYEAASDLSPSRLVAITHWPEGAWASVYSPNRKHSTIPSENILAEYRKRFSG